MRPRPAIPILIVLAALAGCTDTAGPGSSGTPFVATAAGMPNPTGRQIVEFSGAVPADFAARVQGLGGAVVWSSGTAGLAAVSGLSATAAATLSRSPGIKSLTNDMVISLETPSAQTLADAGLAGTASQANPAASFLYPRQWNLRAVHADQAWAAGILGSPTVSVYVLDTGIDYGYLDLQTLVDLGRSTELLGTFSVNGVSFTEADTVQKYFPGRLPIADLYTHGTVVAGAVSSRGIVAAGVTSRTTLVAVKVCSYLNICPISSVLAGVMQPFFLDYQGGRKGALQYDVASLLYDAKADLPPELRRQLLDHYLDTLSGFVKVDREAFMQHYHAFVYVRIMQALGAYGFRGFYERKVHFLQSVPYALKNLRWLLHNVTLPIALPTLLGAFHSMLGSEKLQALASDADSLVVRIFSFSFHRGWPKDESGNGGGFVFDGRSLPNPGREERFKALTGRDAPVIEYLNQQDSVHQFLASVLSLVDASVSEYQRRGFKNLMVSFGCTGGQHRSVYLAEQLAKRLRGRNGVEVLLRHRELETLGP
jgi:hypothetical protein